MPVSHQGPGIRLHRVLRQIGWCVAVVASILWLGNSSQPIYSRALATGEAPDGPHIPLPTTPEDYHLPGTQPNELTEPLTGCVGCHVGHINDNYAGSMMANSARDPLFRAALQVANEDAVGAGEFCIRCHVPNAWLNGRSTPTNGSTFTAADMNGVTCNACHRMVAPYSVPGEASRNANERTFIETSQSTDLMIGSGAHLVDRQDYRRGPFTVSAPHNTQQDSYMRSSLMCATCHEIDNPLLTYDPVTEEFALNALNTPAPVGAKLFPVERTFSEWENSAFNSAEGVTGLSDVYPGIKRMDDTEEGPITVCQDCHMPLIESALVTENGAPVRTVGLHQWAGGSAVWQAGIEAFWDDVAGDVLFDPIAETQTLDSRALGREMLGRAADLELQLNDRLLTMTVINNTGHKLPTGYAEGRRMWLEVVLFQDSQVITRYGGIDAEGNIIAPLKVYEIKQGLTESHAAAVGRPELEGEGFHFALNNKVFKDNRIPPRGWTNAQYEARSMEPVGTVYADGQYTDTVTLLLPEGIDEVDVHLMYQTASGEYLDFLETEADDLVPDAVVGASVNWGEVVGNLRDTLDLDRPEQMLFRGIAVPTLSLEKQISPSSNLLPGQPITFTLLFGNPGLTSVNNVEIADALPSSIANVTVELDLDPSTTLVQTGDAPNLAWNVQGLLDPLSESTIFVRGTVNAQLNADTVINNTVLMSGSNGDNEMNRSALASATVVVPRLQFAPNSISAEEDEGPVQVTVTLDKVNPFASTSLTVSTQDGTARAGSDYVALNNVPLTIAAGATSASFSVQLVDDEAAENNEAFNVVVTSSTGAAVGAANPAAVTIVNEDDGPVVPNDLLFLPATQKD